jgi:hypothetical protein
VNWLLASWWGNGEEGRVGEEGLREGVAVGLYVPVDDEPINRLGGASARMGTCSCFLESFLLV